jgi:DNA-binding transcriptional MerR regulator/methylmalonyl-CoA mutase cobalamin-binding subunit
MQKGSSIRVAAAQTGLTAHVIRAWQKRYHLLDPARSEGGHRLYSAADVQRLTLVAQVTRLGHSISSVAQVPDAELRQMLATAAAAQTPPVPLQAQELNVPAPSAQAKADDLKAEIMAALERIDARAIDEILERGDIALGWQGLLQRVIAPTAVAIGDGWRAGTLMATHEHIFTATVRKFLGSFYRQHSRTENAPRIVIATPQGQVHELGALLVAATAENVGWDATYLGPNLPVTDIIGAAVRRQAKVIALSIIYPLDDPALHYRLKQMKRLLPAGLHLMVGGSGAYAYQETLQAIGAATSDSLMGVAAHLDQLRLQPQLPPAPRPDAQPEPAAPAQRPLVHARA